MIDAWSGPTPTPQQFPANEPNGIRALLDRINAIGLQVKEATSNLLQTAGIYLSPTGMTIDSNLALTGTLSLPNGIINNDALTSPVVAQGIYATNPTGPALSTTAVTLKTVTITVPAGFTSAVVFCTSRVYAANPNANADYLYVLTNIDGVHAADYALLTQGSNVGISPYTQVLTGLTPGSTFDVSVSAHTAYYAWTGMITKSDMSGSILWFR